MRKKLFALLKRVYKINPNAPVAEGLVKGSSLTEHDILKRLLVFRHEGEYINTNKGVFKIPDSRVSIGNLEGCVIDIVGITELLYGTEYRLRKNAFFEGERACDKIVAIHNVRQAIHAQIKTSLKEEVFEYGTFVVVHQGRKRVLYRTGDPSRYVRVE